MKESLLTALFFLVAATSSRAQTNMGIGTDTPNATAALDVTSNTQGILIPRMSLAQRNAIGTNLTPAIGPATSLLIYQTDNTPGFYYNTGTPAAPNWQLLGATGPAGQGFVNGTAPAQVYITSSTFPYAPTNPVTLSGDVALASSGVVAIGMGAVTSPKIADGAVLTNNLASASITIPKISATGMPSATTYLRGDGSWQNPFSFAVPNISSGHPTGTSDATYITPFTNTINPILGGGSCFLLPAAATVTILVSSFDDEGLTYELYKAMPNANTTTYTTTGSALATTATGVWAGGAAVTNSFTYQAGAGDLLTLKVSKTGGGNFTTNSYFFTSFSIH